MMQDQNNSTPTSYSPTVTGSNAKLNIVSRVAIVGRAGATQEGENGAEIKMYLKLSVPVDSVAPGTTIPLFAEENIKIVDWQVHPLDKDSAPYAFSPDTSPLLHHAARSLGLNKPLEQTFHNAFELSPPHGSTSLGSMMNGVGSTRKTKTPPTPVDQKYAGKIMISLYNVAYLVPTVFPRLADSDHSSRMSRRASMPERLAHFMAAIVLWVPFIGKPPRSPYMLSIPTPPRCLSNTIRLRIFPPESSQSSSQASLSDADTSSGAWDLSSDPPVTRKASRYTRPGNAYGDRADDESSDSSSSEPYGISMQGAFPTTDRIRVRWARPPASIGTDDGRRRVGVTDVKAEMTVAVLGTRMDPETKREGIVMGLDYRGKCDNVFFPGVATMLGLDVSLVAKGSDVSWLSDEEAGWQVGGSAGYTGFDVGAPPKSPAPSRHDSIDSNYSNGFLAGERPLSQHSSASSSSASLLRGPLPVNNVPEYSFEGAGGSQSASLESSIMASSLPSGSAESTVLIRPPGVPITIHLDMNKILPTTPSRRNEFSFSLKGTVLVVPRTRNQQTNDSDRDPSDSESVIIPHFSVLATTRSEKLSFLVRNSLDVASSTVEVMEPDSRDKRVLRQGDYQSKGCTEHARVLVRSGITFSANSTPPVTNGRLPPSRPRTPNLGSRERVMSVSNGTRAMAVLGMAPVVPRPKRDGTLMIPSVRADVTPMVDPAHSGVPSSYAVRVVFAAPADADSEWLEFGLAKQSDARADPPKVDIVCVTVDDVPVLYETRTADPAVKQEDAGLSLEQIGGQEWLSWVKMHVGAGAGHVVVDYVVRGVHGSPAVDPKGKGKMKARQRAQFDVYLPSFRLPVGRLEVHIDTIPGFEISDLRSNFAHQQEIPSGRKLLRHSLPGLFYPHISLNLSLDRRRSNVVSFAYLLFASTAVLIFAMVYIARMNPAPEMVYLPPGHGVDALGGREYLTLGNSELDEKLTVTVTTTVYHSSAQTPGRWAWPQFGHAEPSPTTDADVESPSDDPPPPAPTPSPEPVPSSQPAPVVITTPGAGREQQPTSLILAPRLPFPWLSGITWPPKVPFDTKLLKEKARIGAAYAMWLYKLVLHFPLG
uniref:Uncharacterized protein n=1 Tax=Mycena chlorophos TaxID=658473 RepID=A0ABQ0KWK2_MYCCL|nr:predicted protein [Mycena chlorophos]